MKTSKDEIESLDLIFRSSEFYKHNIKSLENPNAQGTKYTKTYNLVYIIIATGTPVLLFLGAVMLLSYLNSINSTNLFIENISTLTFINLLSFYGLANIFTYIVIILPSLYIVMVHAEKPEKIRSERTLLCLSLIPILFTPITLVVYYLVSLTSFEEYISDYIHIYILLYLMVYLFLSRKEWLEQNRKINFDRLFYVILFCAITISFSFLILTSDINNNEIIVYVINFVLFIMISIFFNKISIQEIKRKNGKSLILIKQYLFGFLAFLILNPIIPDVINAFAFTKEKNIDYTYSYKTMKILGYADKKEKIYFINKNMIDSKIGAEPFLEQKIDTKEKLYRPYCGKIYFRTNESVVFKLKDKNQKEDFKQIPKEDIFELQNMDYDYCSSYFLSDFSTYYSRFINMEYFQYILNKSEYSSESFNNIKFIN